MLYTFTPGAWEDKNLQYAYSWRFERFPQFRQEADCIENNPIPDVENDFDYMGLMTPERYGPGTTLSVKMRFENLAAPMLLLSWEHELDDEGHVRTLEYYEIVIWKYGLNVWRHYTNSRVPGHYLTLGAAFSLEESTIHTLKAEILSHRVKLTVDGGHSLDLYLPDLPESLNLGFCACEGICGIYDMEIDTP